MLKGRRYQIKSRYHWILSHAINTVLSHWSRTMTTNGMTRVLESISFNQGVLSLVICTCVSRFIKIKYYGNGQKKKNVSYHSCCPSFTGYWRWCMKSTGIKNNLCSLHLLSLAMLTRFHQSDWNPNACRTVHYVLQCIYSNFLYIYILMQIGSVHCEMYNLPEIQQKNKNKNNKDFNLHTVAVGITFAVSALSLVRNSS